MFKFKSAKVERWVILFAVSLVGGIITKLPYLKDTYYPTLQKATGATNVQIGLLLTMYGIMNFICYFPGGILADKISPKKLIVFSCFSTGLVGFWYATLPNFTSLLIIHAMFGITTVFTFWASMVKITNNLGQEEEQGKLFGFLEGGRGLIGTLVALGSVYVFSRFTNEIMGLRGGIVFYSVMLIVAGLVVILIVRDPQEKKASQGKEESSKVTWKDFKTVTKIPRVWLCGLIVACNYGSMIFFGFFTPYFSQIYGMSNSAVALMGVFRAYILMLMGSLLAGLLADKMKSVIRFMQLGYGAVTIFSFLYLLIPTNRALLWLVLINFVMQGLFLLGVKALYFAPIDEMNIPKSLAGTASGIISIVGYAPEMFLYIVAGSLLDKHPGIAGFNLIFILTGVLSIVGFILTMILRNSNKKERLKIESEKGVIL